MRLDVAAIREDIELLRGFYERHNKDSRAITTVMRWSMEELYERNFREFTRKHLDANGRLWILVETSEVVCFVVLKQPCWRDFIRAMEKVPGKVQDMAPVPPDELPSLFMLLNASVSSGEAPVLH